MRAGGGWLKRTLAQCALAAANSFKMSLPFATAASRPSLAVFLPAKTFSSSPSIASRIWTKFPSRWPRLLGVGLAESWLSAVHCSGFFLKWYPASRFLIAVWVTGT